MESGLHMALVPRVVALAPKSDPVLLWWMVRMAGSRAAILTLTKLLRAMMGRSAKVKKLQTSALADKNGIPAQRRTRGHACDHWS